MEPDGKLVIAAWDHETQDKSVVLHSTYEFRHMMWWKRMPEGLMIKFDWGTTTISWHQILNYDVYGNSQDYVDWHVKQRTSDHQDFAKLPWDQQMFIRNKEKRAGKARDTLSDFQTMPHG